MDEIFVFLQLQLKNHLERKFGVGNGNVEFLSSGNWDPLAFGENELTFLLINLEEDKIMNPPDRFQRVNAVGKSIKIQPEIRLNLYLLIVSHFGTYTEALKQLTATILFFQNNRFFQPQSFPEIPEDVGQLSLELMTLSFSEQNEIWSSLKAAYHPSALYKIKLLYLQKEETDLRSDIQETSFGLSGQ